VLRRFSGVALDVLDRCLGAVDRLDTVDIVRFQPCDGQAGIECECDFRERAGGTVDGDDGVAIQNDERVAGVAHSSGNGGVDVLVRRRAVRPREDADGVAPGRSRARADGLHDPGVATTDHLVSALAEQSAHRLGQFVLRVGDDRAADDAHTHTPLFPVERLQVPKGTGGRRLTSRP